MFWQVGSFEFDTNLELDKHWNKKADCKIQQTKPIATLSQYSNQQNELQPVPYHYKIYNLKTKNMIPDTFFWNNYWKRELSKLFRYPYCPKTTHLLHQLSCFVKTMNNFDLLSKIG